jgi:selenocysteine-specific elongation factor
LVATHTQTKARTLANTVVFHRDAIDTAGERLRNAFGARGGFETSEAKSALGVSRKFLIPLLEHFDAQRVTRRNGDRREFVSRPDSATT